MKQHSVLDPQEVISLHAGQHIFQLIQLHNDTSDESGPMDVTRICDTTIQEYVCDNMVYYPTPVDPEYQRRIFACLRYCHGMHTETLEKQADLLGVP